VTLLEEIHTLIVRHAGGAPRRLVADGVGVGVAPGPTEPVSGMAAPSFTLVTGGVKRTVLGGQVHDYRAGQYLVVSVDVPVTGHVLRAESGAPFAAVSLTLDRAQIASLLLAASAARSASSTGSALVVSDADDRLLDAVARLLRMVEQPADLAVLGPAVRREIHWRLLAGGQGAAVRRIGVADGGMTSVTRATGWIREHYDEPLRLEHLAALTGMSLSSLHRHFRAATSMTPLQYQKRIRLQEARALLLATDRDVAQVAHRVGYESASQFSREYRRQFGATPTTDRDTERAKRDQEPVI
jgi:AraC-like DNA-binding protein